MPPQTTQQPSLREQFEQLSTQTRDWLTSEATTYILSDLNKRLGMAGPLASIIPYLITRLVTGDLFPHQFTHELELELDIEPDNARRVAYEIVEKILKPVENALRISNIDINQIDAEAGPINPSAYVEVEPIMPREQEVQPPPAAAELQQTATADQFAPRPLSEHVAGFPAQPDTIAPPPTPPESKPSQMFKVPVSIGPVGKGEEETEEQTPRVVHYNEDTSEIEKNQ